MKICIHQQSKNCIPSCSIERSVSEIELMMNNLRFQPLCRVMVIDLHVELSLEWHSFSLLCHTDSITVTIQLKMVEKPRVPVKPPTHPQKVTANFPTYHEQNMYIKCLMMILNYVNYWWPMRDHLIKNTKALSTSRLEIVAFTFAFTYLYTTFFLRETLTQ